MRFSSKQMLIAATTIGVILCAYMRGNYLLGQGAGMLYALLGAGLSFLMIRAFASRGRVNWDRRIGATILAIVIFSIFSFPTTFNESIGNAIARREAERINNSQLRHIINSDTRFTDLRYESHRWKCLVYYVRGTVDSESALDDLRKRIFNGCPDISQRWLYWDLTITETGTRYDDCDLSIFGELPVNEE